MHSAVIALRPGLGRLHSEQAQGGDLAKKVLFFLFICWAGFLEQVTVQLHEYLSPHSRRAGARGRSK